MATRRDVMAGGVALAAAAAVPAFAADPPGSPLGVAQTALGAWRRANKGYTTVQAVDYARSLGAAGIQIAVPLDEDLKVLRRRLDRHGMFLEGDIRLIARPGDDTADFEKGLRRYRELGAPCVRTVCFVGRRYENFNSLQDYKDWKANADAVLAVCVPIAEKVGIPLAMENHKDRVVDEEVEVLRRYSSRHLGALVDFGNNIAMCDDPVEVIAKLAPYAQSCHMKNMAVAPYADGFLLSEVVFEDGFLDIPALWAVLKKANPALRPVHELITRDPLKVPVLTDKYWVTWPDRGGKYLADTLRLVNANATKRPLPVVSTLSPPEQLAVERDNNIKCFDWARRALT
jgi:sugar phosphate isomerase/epimerase